MPNPPRDVLPLGSPFDCTERVRRVIALAFDEARQNNCTEVTPDHLLLAVVREGKGLLVRLFASWGLTGDCIRAQLLTQLADAHEPAAQHLEMELGPASVQVMRLATQEAHQRGDATIGIEDLLLGIMGTRCRGAEILHATGMRTDVVRAQIAQLSSGSLTEADPAQE